VNSVEANERSAPDRFNDVVVDASHKFFCGVAVSVAGFCRNSTPRQEISDTGARTVNVGSRLIQEMAGAHCAQHSAPADARRDVLPNVSSFYLDAHRAVVTNFHERADESAPSISPEAGDPRLMILLGQTENAAVVELVFIRAARLWRGCGRASREIRGSGFK
jgi:hypothetical protein